MRNRSSVVIVENNHVLLMRREKNDEVYYVFPGGGVEIDETPEGAAVREAFEELGVRVNLLGILDVIQFQGIQYFFTAEIVSGTIGTGKGEEYSNPERGSYQPMFIPLDELISLPVYPKEMTEKVRMMGGNKVEKWKTIRSEYHYKTPFGNLRKDTCQMPDGQVIEGYYVHEYADWVNAIVLTKEGNVVLVEQYRHAGNDLFLEIPAGKMEDGETYEEAVIREVREETGFTSKNKPVCLGEFFVNPAVQTNKVITYLITEAEQHEEQQLDETEVIDVHLYSLKEMEELIENKRLTQLFSVSAYYMALNHLNKVAMK